MTARAVACHAKRYRVDYNTVRPHEALAWNRPHDVHVGLADPPVPTFPSPKSRQLLDAGHRRVAGRINRLWSYGSPLDRFLF